MTEYELFKVYMSYLKDEIPFCHSTFRSELRSGTHCDIFILDTAFTAMPRTEKEIQNGELERKQNAKLKVRLVESKYVNYYDLSKQPS